MRLNFLSVFEAQNSCHNWPHAVEFPIRKALSQQRAKAVVDAVTAQGVAPARMSAVGWGQDKPVADNRSHAGRARNRRVEMLKQ
jgi:outer membrane protein OmpA-like peptidoglycan-associated protein